MLRAAETLAAGHDFLRFHFFEIDGAPRFGVLWLYPGSDLDRFADERIDLELGDLVETWRQECQCQLQSFPC